ncbi:MAG TPA: hypothetical protein ENJ20_05735 [Bacteroidetes bacterium]|nr:hypothetical protein [Bacteroidota bacterium]
MNIRNAVPVLLVFCFLLPSCQRPFLSDGPAPKATWEMANLEMERQILQLHATPFQWYAISENQFARFDHEDKLLEKRPLPTGAGVLGFPALTDTSFARLLTNDSAKQIFEFRLSRNPDELYTIPVEELAGPSDGFVEVEFRANQLGAFSSDGTLFLLPLKILPDHYYALALFRLLHDASFNSFSSIEMIHRIDLPDLSTDLPRLRSIRFINGNFYVTSQQGAWRITPSGQSQKIFSQWMLDAFPYQGNIFITGLNSFDLHKSTDNGVTWERLNQNSDLQLVENANESLFTHTAPGVAFQLADDQLIDAKNIVLPEGYSPQDPVFFDLIFFGEKYYFGLGKKVFTTQNIVTE